MKLSPLFFKPFVFWFTIYLFFSNNNENFLCLFFINYAILKNSRDKDKRQRECFSLC